MQAILILNKSLRKKINKEIKNSKNRKKDNKKKINTGIILIDRKNILF